MDNLEKGARERSAAGVLSRRQPWCSLVAQCQICLLEVDYYKILKRSSVDNNKYITLILLYVHAFDDISSCVNKQLRPVLHEK